MGPVLAVRPDAKSPAASKQVEFVLASVQTVEQIAAKCKIPTIADEVTVELMLEASRGSNKPPCCTALTAEENAANASQTETSAERARGSGRRCTRVRDRLPPRRKTFCASKPDASTTC